MQEATQIHNTSEGGDIAESLCRKYSDVFKNELGVLQPSNKGGEDVKESRYQMIDLVEVC